MEVRKQAMRIVLGNSTAGRGNSACGDEVGECLVCAGNSKEAKVVGAEGGGK